MLSRFMSKVFSIKPRKTVIDNRQEIEAERQYTHDYTHKIKKSSIERSQKAAKSFEQTGKKVYDVAEKIYIATGQK